ncbi:MAG: histidine triad nucleotide-binding protein [Thermomicrobiales bacterium]
MPDYDASCIFCKIARHEIPTAPVYDADGIVAFRDINPQAPTHILVIPEHHYPSLNEASADPELLGRLLAVAQLVAVQEGLDQRGYRAVINTGADAGQSVGHLHIHLLGGRQLGWPPG